MGSASEADQAAAEALKAEGNEFFKKKNFLKAAGCYTKAARKDKSNPVYHSNLAAALIGLAKYDKAIKACEACIKLDADFEKGHYRLACALLGAERFDEAVVEFEATLALNGANKEAKKKLTVAVRGSLTAHKEAGTEPPDATAKYRKVRSEAEIAAAEAKKAQRAQEKSEAAKFKFPKGTTKPAGAGGAAETGDEGDGPAPADIGAGSGEKPTVQSSIFQPDEDAAVSAPEEVDAAMARLAEGAELPYSTERVVRFMALEIAELCKVENAKAYAYPIAIFLPGVQKEGWGDEGQGVGMRACFDSADTHKNAVPFLRQYAERTQAHAMLMIAAKSQIAFPQVWRRKDKPWPYGDAPGYFVQLDAKQGSDRRAWFVEVAGTETAPEYRRHVLDESLYCIMAPVLRPILLDNPSVPRDFAADRATQGQLGGLGGAGAAAAPAAPVPEEDFEAAAEFSGAQAGWYFGSGANGVGYYRDASSPSPPPPSTPPS